MFVRLISVNFLQGKLEEAKRIYHDELVPVVRQQKGNLDCRLLEPVDNNEDYVSMTTWESKVDADAYHNKGVYKNLVDQVRPFFSKEPVLRVYQSDDVMEHA